MVKQKEREAPGQTLSKVPPLLCQNLMRSLVALGTNMIYRLIERGSAWLLAAFVLLLCAGCRSSTEAPLPEQPTAKTAVNLSPGDVIKLTFTGAPDLNQSQKIRADGKLSLPLIGEVTAAGKTLIEFQNELMRLYKPQLRNSDVIVTLESGIAQVVVSGAVTKPAKLTFDRPTTVFQAIMEAGGASEYGPLRKVHLIRTVNGKQLTQVLDLRPALSGKATSALYVRDGDVIYVPQSVF
jgi:protein involved in polysaccharide export with SLBB domain